jgi:hypothetical protein
MKSITSTKSPKFFPAYQPQIMRRVTGPQISIGAERRELAVLVGQLIGIEQTSGAPWVE